MNRRQKRFVDEYLVDLNATQAALRAGYSSKTAVNIGYENLTKLYIVEAIEKRMTELQDSKVAEIREVLEFLTAAMRGDIEEAVVVNESFGDGTSNAKTIFKQLPAKDRLKAAELLGKRYGMFTDRFTVEGAIPVVIHGEDELE